MTTTVHEKLKAVREKHDIELPRPPNLRETVQKRDGSSAPFKLRPYQQQMVVHLMAMKRFIVGDDTGLGKCQPYDSLVLTDRGLIPMGEIADWSEMGPDTFRDLDRPLHVLVGEEYLPVRRFYYGGVKPTVVMETRYGFVNKGSRVHPVLVLRDGQHRWVESQDLVEGDYLCVDRRVQDFPETEPRLPDGPGPDRMSPDLARFLGYYVGEGGLTNKYQVRITQCPETNPEVHQDILRLFKDLFGKSPTDLNKSEIYVGDVRLRRWLAEAGFGYVRSLDREIPSCLLRATRASSREFLRGLFEGEGHAGRSHIEFSTASETLGKQVQIMLLRFGVVSRRAPKKIRGRDHTYWRITICGRDAEVFRERIGFISTRKMASLDACLDRPRNTNHDVIPGISDLVENVREALREATSRKGSNAVRRGSGLKQFGVSFVNTLNNIRNYGRDPSYDFIAQCADLLRVRAPDSEVLTMLESFLNSHYFYDPVVSLTSGEEEVFDIEVDDPRHCFISNGFVNHNTIETIASLCHLWKRDPDMKAVVLTKKSSVPQWEDEFAKFTEGINVIMAVGNPKQRAKAHDEWENATGPTVLIQGYTSAGNDFGRLQHWEGYTLIMDEVTVVKTPTTRVHKVCKHLSSQAGRCWGLTATLIKNNLMEGYGIYRVVVPDLFRMTANAFMQNYCITRMQRVANGRMVPQIVGYRQSDIEKFRDQIDLYYLGRPKHAVATDLPVLTTKNVKVGLTKFQHEKYQEALGGLLELGSGDERETTQLTALIYCQEIVNHPALIEYPDYTSEKLDALLDMVTDGGDLHDEKVIVFTRFKEMVNTAIPVLEKAGIRCVRVTGDESEQDRREAMNAFQNPDDPVRVIWITMAGGDAINLQAAKAIVFYDTPWSAGDYIQIVGRMIRIGSDHDTCYAIHLVCRDTIDERVQQVVRKKMNLIEGVLGARVKGEKGEDTVYDTGSEVKDLYDAMIADARTSVLGSL